MAPPLNEMTSDQLIAALGQPGSQRSHEIEMEFLRRQTVAQQSACLAQEQAAGAAAATAKYTKQNATYLFYSVIVLTLSSVATFVLSVLAYLNVPK